MGMFYLLEDFYNDKFIIYQIKRKSAVSTGVCNFGAIVKLWPDHSSNQGVVIPMWHHGIQEVASSILVSSTTERTPFPLIFLDLP
jgi:hypothetical protein